MGNPPPVSTVSWSQGFAGRYSHGASDRPLTINGNIGRIRARKQECRLPIGLKRVGKSFWLLAPDFSYPVAYWRVIKGAPLADSAGEDTCLIPGGSSYPLPCRSSGHTGSAWHEETLQTLSVECRLRMARSGSSAFFLAFFRRSGIADN